MKHSGLMSDSSILYTMCRVIVYRESRHSVQRNSHCIVNTIHPYTVRYSALDNSMPISMFSFPYFPTLLSLIPF